ncbi:hypothetical protein BC835DRAFT_1313442 [Cytidiella melzeri]|nr:hypothetical protein BC835DRAFT_1313442 [Cytidiella melzeri]
MRHIDVEDEPDAGSRDLSDDIEEECAKCVDVYGPIWILITKRQPYCCNPRAGLKTREICQYASVRF